MRAVCLFVFACMFSAQAAMAQEDILIGILRDANEEIVAKYPVALGKKKARKVKTDRNGIFIIRKANLNDTLYISIKSQKRDIRVPVNGNNYVSITMKEGSFTADHTMPPDIYELQRMLRERKNTTSSTYLNKNEIMNSGCTDIFCLLSRMGGVTINSGGRIRIRGISNLSEADPLLLVDGANTYDSSILSSIPVQDINEISLIKDGSNYGVQGANGVIIIKTGNK